MIQSEFDYLFDTDVASDVVNTATGLFGIPCSMARAYGRCCSDLPSTLLYVG